MAAHGELLMSFTATLILSAFSLNGVTGDEPYLHVRVGNFRLPAASMNDNISVLIYDLLNSSRNLSFPSLNRSAFSKFKIWDANYQFLGINVTSTTNNSSYIGSYEIHEEANFSNTNMTISIYGNPGELEYFVEWNGHDSGDWVDNIDKVDVALMKLSNNASFPVNYSTVSGDCYQCAPYYLGTIYPGQTLFFGVDTKFEYNLLFNEPRMNASLWKNHTYGDHGRYHARIVHENDQSLRVDIQEDDPGINPYLPILYAAILITGIALIYTAIRFLNWRYKIFTKIRVKIITNDKFEQDFGNPPSTLSGNYGTNSSLRHSLVESKEGRNDEKNVLIPSKENSGSLVSSESSKMMKKKRLHSLDTFRGMSLVIMIFVNYGGGGYWFFDHSRWNGLTVADLVFPWFVWIMGVSIVYSFKSRQSDSLYMQLYQVIRRSIILFALGLFLNQQTNLAKLRIPGVLQRFAISYFVVALTELLTTRFVYKKKRLHHRVFHQFRDLTNNWIQLIVTLLFMVLWLLLTFLTPLDILEDGTVKCPRGYLGPGGLADHGRYSVCTGGAAKAIDKWMFGVAHIYQHPTCEDIYHCLPHDPEGLLGSLTSIAMCFLGLQCGKILKHFKDPRHRVGRMLVWGLVLCLVAAALCEFQKDGGAIPLNKNLWSLSFILVMAGTGYIVLSLFYVLVDVANIWTGAPFIFPGMNSIFVYVGSEMVRGFPFFWDGPNTHIKLLSENLIAVSLWVAVSYYCYWIGFFVKI